MRIPSGTTDRKIFFVAVDSTDLKTRETGLTTFTVYRSRNGGTAAAMTTPTVAELDATNMPGVYSLLLDEDTTLSAGNDAEELCVHITQAAMAPVTRAVELYRPETTEGNMLDVTATGAGGIDWGNVENPATAVDLSATDIQLCDTVTTNTDVRGTDNALLAASAPTNFGDLAITVTTGKVTVGTNGDKTGYALSTAGVDAIWDEAQSGHVTTGTFGYYLDQQVSLAIAPTAAAVADAVWDETNGDHVTAGSTGKALDDVLTDTGTTLDTKLNDIQGATFSSTTDSLEAIRNRGDTAWITATSVTVSDKTGFALASTGVDLVLVDGKTLPASLQVVAALCAGIVSGAGTGTEVFKGLDKATTRATVTVDASGNRTGIVYV